PTADLVVIESNLGFFDLNAGHLDRSRKEIESAIALYSRMADPPIQLEAAELNLGLINRLEGRGQEALANFEKALATVQRTAGPDSVWLLSPRIEVAYQRALNGDAAAVENDLRTCMEGANKPPAAERERALLALGHVLTLAGKAGEGEPLLRECL